MLPTIYESYPKFLWKNQQLLSGKLVAENCFAAKFCVTSAVVASPVKRFKQSSWWYFDQPRMSTSFSAPEPSAIPWELGGALPGCPGSRPVPQGHLCQLQIHPLVWDPNSTLWVLLSVALYRQLMAVCIKHSWLCGWVWVCEVVRCLCSQGCIWFFSQVARVMITPPKG